MGNGVVDMEKVEGLVFENFDHFGGESEGVRRVIEERIRRDFDFVEMDVGIVEIHPNGRGVGDEMDVVAARCELDAQFGSHNPASAVRGITGDSYFQAASLA